MTMTKSNMNLDRGGVAYGAPVLKVFSVSTEKGFASSPDPKYDWTNGALGDDVWNDVLS